MKTISLRDAHFSHSKNGYSCDFHPAKNVVWSREFPYKSDLTVFTGASVHEVQTMANKVNIAWIVEPAEIYPYPYDVLIKNHKYFDLILSHDIEFLKLIPNGCFISYGDCWISEEDWKIYDKSEMCSIFCSEKKMTTQHILRHECLKVSGIDKFGYMNHVGYKLDGLKNYEFSIVVENSKRDDWFTEKLLDCFATGTVPIYCGTHNIGKYFDLSGMIRFDSFQELEFIMDMIKTKSVKYQDFFVGINNNFQTFQKFVRKDDIVLSKLEERNLI